MSGLWYFTRMLVGSCSPGWYMMRKFFASMRRRFMVAGSAVSILIGKLLQLAEERAALRRVATLVAHATRVDELFAAVSEGGRLVAVDFARLACLG